MSGAFVPYIIVLSGHFRTEINSCFLRYLRVLDTFKYARSIYERPTYLIVIVL